MPGKLIIGTVLLASSVLFFTLMAKPGLVLRILLPINRFFLSLFGQDVVNEDLWAFWQRVNMFFLGVVLLVLGLLFLLVPAEQL